MKIGIIGCGFIGGEIASFIDRDRDFKFIGLNDIDKNKARNLINNLKNSKPKFMELNDLIEKSDLIIECAAKNVITGILTNKNLDKKIKNCW